MPIYEFRCQECGNEIEVIQKISDPHITDCDACGKAEMRKKVTAAAFRLSGAGWYETDFKKEGDKKKNLTESDAKKETKSDSDSSKKDNSTKASSTDANSTPTPKNQKSTKSTTE